jgi:dihydrofolate reductase
MRKIINSTYVSLDGVISNPHVWTSEYFQEEAQQYAYGLLFSSDALLMGRKTYEGFAAAWPNMEEQTGDFGVRMNTMPKYAVSTTLKDPEWKNTTVISTDVAAELARLKEQDGQDILQYGFGAVTRLLIDHGLLDELRLWVHPVFVGARDTDDVIGGPGFQSTFALADSQTFANGVVIQTYRPATDK